MSVKLYIFLIKREKKGIFGGDMGEMQYDITHKSTWFLAET